MRKIAVFTGTRAEYGLLYWVIKRIQDSCSAELQLFVGGMHLSHEFGYTVDQIEKDGFPISEKLEFLLSSDTPVGIAKSMGLALISTAEAFERRKPDLLVLLGDRFESMAVAQAAMAACIPIAHLHGGETTEGLIDEAVRHSITKMSHMHFTGNEIYRKRVIQLGENPLTVFNFGATAIDNIVNMKLLERGELSSSVGFDLDGDYLMITYHPVTLESGGAAEALNNLLEALSKFPTHKLVITFPNADTHGRGLIDILERFAESNADRVLLVQSLGQLRYLSLLKYCSAVIGNSSSGIVEAPAFQVPTVNIGTRQQGRWVGDTVIDSGEGREQIIAAIQLALTEEFIDICKYSKSPFGTGDSSEKIVNQLINFPLENIIKKSFYDLKGG